MNEKSKLANFWDMLTNVKSFIGNLIFLGVLLFLFSLIIGSLFTGSKNIDPQGMKREGSGLSVKGTSIIGFDEENSRQKTLRKPEVQLNDFKACGKVKLRTYLDDIKTIDTKLNGRCNPDTLLLKVN